MKHLVLFFIGARVLPTGISFGAAGATTTGALALSVPIAIGVAIAGLAVAYGLAKSNPPQSQSAVTKVTER